MSEFEISEMSLGSGIIGMSPLPGAKGDYATEMAAWLQWKPDAKFEKLEPRAHHDQPVLPENHELENAAIGYFRCANRQEYRQSPISSSRPDLL